MLAAYVPGGQERAFEEFRQLPADVVAEKYDSEFVGPPLQPIAERRPGADGAALAPPAEGVTSTTTQPPAPRRSDRKHPPRPIRADSGVTSTRCRSGSKRRGTPQVHPRVWRPAAQGNDGA